MTKTVCDIDGNTPAIAYKLVANLNTTFVAIDLCDKCVDDLTNHIRGLIKVDDVQAVVKK